MNIFDKRPLFLILTVAISGFVGFTFSGGILKGILCAIALLLLILSLFLFYKKRISTNPLLIILPAVLLISMICSFIYFDLYFKIYNHYEGEVTIEGKIISYENDSYTSNIIVKTSKIDGKIKYGHTVRMSLEKYMLDERFNIGSKISFSGNICEFEDFSDMDANTYYFAKGIGADVQNVRNVRYLGKGDLPLSYYTESIRLSVFDGIDSLSDSKAASLFAALFTGERDLLNDQIKLDFRRLGITHILALSGLHLSIISLGLSRVLSALQIKKKPRLIIIAAFIVLYMVLTGLSVSVVRAGIMILIYTALFLLGKTKDSITSLAVSVFLILLFRPFAVYDLALWLSALATLGIVAYESEEEYTEKTSLWKNAIRYIIASLKASFFATSATLLISVVAFGALSIASAVATLIFSLLSEAIIYIGMLMLVFGRLIPLKYVLIPISDFTYYLSGIMADPDWIYLSADYVFVLIAAILYTLCLIAFLVLPIYNKRKASLVLAICFTAFMALSLIANLVSINDDKVVYSSSESGDSIILRSNSDTALIYSGKHSASSAYEEFELLESYKINSLDYYFISNYSGRLESHILKMLSLIKIDCIYLPSPKNAVEETIYKNLCYDIEDFKVEIILHNVKSTVDLGEFKLEQGYRTEYGDYKNKVAISIKTDSERIVYLSSGMLDSTEKIVALGMAAKANTVIFGRHGSKYYDTTYISDMLYDSIDRIIISSENLKFKEYALDFYKTRDADILLYENAVILED